MNREIPLYDFIDNTVLSIQYRILIRDNKISQSVNIRKVRTTVYFLSDLQIASSVSANSEGPAFALLAFTVTCAVSSEQKLQKTFSWAAREIHILTFFQKVLVSIKTKRVVKCWLAPLSYFFSEIPKELILESEQFGVSFYAFIRRFCLWFLRRCLIRRVALSLVVNMLCWTRHNSVVFWAHTTIAPLDFIPTRENKCLASVPLFYF